MFIKNLKDRLQKQMTDTNESSNVIDIIKVDSDVRNERMNICRGCEHIIKTTNTCKKCGCFMSVKTWIKNSKCPINKW